MFSGKEDHAITLEDARAMLQRWTSGRTSLPGDPSAEFFGREALQRILAQPGCVGLRIYHGRNPKNQHALVLVGTDAAGRDLVAGGIAESGLPCPIWCDDTSALRP